jgi:hypothetical protein
MFQIQQDVSFFLFQKNIDFIAFRVKVKTLDYGIILTRWQHAKSVFRILSKTNTKN